MYLKLITHLRLVALANRRNESNLTFIKNALNSNIDSLTNYVTN